MKRFSRPAILAVPFSSPCYRLPRWRPSISQEWTMVTLALDGYGAWERQLPAGPGLSPRKCNAISGDRAIAAPRSPPSGRAGRSGSCAAITTCLLRRRTWRRRPRKPGPADLPERCLSRQLAPRCSCHLGRSAPLATSTKEVLGRVENKPRQVKKATLNECCGAGFQRIMLMSDSSAAAKISPSAPALPSLLSTAAMTGGADAATMPCGRRAGPCRRRTRRGRTGQQQVGALHGLQFVGIP